jgi:UDP-N-acetylmuramoylalanine--D-glutamate ligase
LKKIKGKNITVIGLARSGVGAANLLAELGAQVTVTDARTEDKLQGFITKLSAGVKRVLGEHPDYLFTSADMIVISPGVPLNIKPLSLARSKGISIISELELAYQIINMRNSEFGIRNVQAGRETQFLAVTGTNGKSTTTALLDFMMKNGGFKTILGGNIGNALTDEIYKQRAENQEQRVDWFVAEISSFQLEAIRDFRPKGAALLNVTPDHLDRYHSIEEYGDAKARVFENQTYDDFLVLNRDDPETMKIFNAKCTILSPASQLGRQNTKLPRVYFFSRKEKVEGLYSADGKIWCNLPLSSFVPRPLSLIGIEEIKIKGVHNLENAMAASAMALLAGCPVEAVMDSLRRFEGLEHRLEPVRELGGVTYINDSKGTNVGAVLKSLESFSNPVILIAGGRDKAGEFSLLRDPVKERVKALILIGEASEKIKKALGDVTRTVMAQSLKDAVKASRDLAEKGEIVLLSPACASFDMFADFEDRGRQFKRIVMELK